MNVPQPPPEILALLRRGVVIPACPLVLDAQRRLDHRRQRALLRYYRAAGAGGIGVGVHTTQFEIRRPGIGLYRPLLELAVDTLNERSSSQPSPVARIAGVCGPTRQAVAEAELAAALGYAAALLSLGALPAASEDELIEHCRQVGAVIPLFGFYLQPAVGGRILSRAFWRRFAQLGSVVAIKIAPFNRYQTLDVVRAVGESGRAGEVALYTGNDDNIIPDLLTPFAVRCDDGWHTLRIRGGLLGQWSVWTRRAVELLDRIHRLIDQGGDIPVELLQTHSALTDANAAIFDAAHHFAGCIPGINEMLRRRGLMEHAHCLDPAACLSRGQAEELDRVERDYPWLTDDTFVAEHLDEWLA